VKFEAFEERARALWEEIPASYRAGVDGLTVVREARSHAELADVYTLGECLTESYPSEFGGPETTRSSVVLYYGSFWRLARGEPGFDWQGEIWETLTHELQHHLESLATEDALEAVDYAADENFRRQQGEPFEPLFFRSGEPLGGSLYRIESEYFLELEVAADAQVAEFAWHEARYRAALPAARPDVLFVELEGLAADDVALTLAVRPQRRWRERLRRLLGGGPLATETVTAEVERVDAERTR
jgi:hypothetical protein